jgi:tRNA dimethylallyltransferase
VREKLRGGRKKREDSLYERQKEVDPSTASTVHPRDLFGRFGPWSLRFNGGPISFFRDKHQFRENLITLKIGLQMDRSTLYQRIEERVDRMIEREFLTEVRRLLEMGYARN